MKAAAAQPTAASALAIDPRDPRLQAYLNLKLREIGQPGVALPDDGGVGDLVGNFLALSREKDRALARHLCPVDQRIQNFLFDYIDGAAETPRLPNTTLVLDRPGLARALISQDYRTAAPLMVLLAAGDEDEFAVACEAVERGIGAGGDGFGKALGREPHQGAAPGKFFRGGADHIGRGGGRSGTVGRPALAGGFAGGRGDEVRDEFIGHFGSSGAGEGHDGQEGEDAVAHQADSNGTQGQRQSYNSDFAG